MRKQQLPWLIGLGLAAVVLLPGPYVFSPYLTRLATSLFLFAALAQSWNLIGGYAGYLSLAHPAFFGTGAMVTAILMLSGHLPLALALLGGAVIAGVFAVIVGYPTLRLKGHYFVIGSLLVAEAARQIALNFHWFGINGAVGINLQDVVPKWALRQYNAYYYYGFLLLAILITLLVWLVARSRWGYALRSLRANETAAELMGIPVVGVKLAAFVVSAATTAVVGGLWGHWTTVIGVSEAFDVMLTIQVMIMTMLGGLGTVTGPLLGVVLIKILSEIIDLQFAETNPIVFGLLVIVLVLGAPAGLQHLLRQLWRRLRPGTAAAQQGGRLAP